MNNENTILVVDDEAEIRDLLSIILRENGYNTILASDGEEAVDILTNNKEIDLVILDIMMPKLSGTEACRIIRTFSSVPILFLSAKSKEPDFEEAYEGGGDDFLVKPFVESQLLRKINALIRRYNAYKGKADPSSASNDTIIYEDITVKLTERKVFKADEQLKLTVKEFELLSFLLKHRGQSYNNKALYEAIWEDSYLPSSANTVMVHVLRLRQKIEDDPTKPVIIRTIYGKGYQID